MFVEQTDNRLHLSSPMPNTQQSVPCTLSHFSHQHPQRRDYHNFCLTFESIILRLRIFSVYHLDWNFDPCMPSPRTQAWPQNLGSLLPLHGVQPGALLLNTTLLSRNAELTLLIWKLDSSTLIGTQWFLLLNSALLHVTVVFKLYPGLVVSCK